MVGRSAFALGYARACADPARRPAAYQAPRVCEGRMSRIFRYVKHSDIATYKADGWALADLLADCHHGVHAVLMWRDDDGE